MFPNLLTRAWLMVFVTMMLTPMLFAIGPKLETHFFPVVNETRIENLTKTERGVEFYVRFDKTRQCEFLGIAWYQGPLRIGVAIEPDSNLFPKTRPEGDQFAGPWLVSNVDSLEGTKAFVYHNCHPLWITISPFYP